MTNKFTIKRNILSDDKKRTPPSMDEDIAFGKINTDHMFSCDYDRANGGWQQPKIEPYGPIELYPDTTVFHYGQEIFEGMKAYLGEPNKSSSNKPIFLFRPESNAKRFQVSAARLGMAEVPVELFVQGIKELINVDSNWVPASPGSLYVRPFLIATSRGVSYHAADKYKFMVILSPAKSYYKAPKGVTVYVEQEYVRAVEGGVGYTKCGGNYGGSLLGMQKALSKGADQVLWLDALEHQYVEEVGSMNVMFCYGKKIITPKLSGSILPGITRDSLIKIAPTLGYEISEEKISIHKIADDIKNGKITEIFGCGTAVVVSPVSRLMFDDRTLTVADGEVGPVATKLKETLLAIQSGNSDDPFDWRLQVN
jgi:branched-chain amino acid aminotransferase